MKTAIILAPDQKGVLPVFRIPTVRRLALLLSRIGLQSLHVIGETAPLRPLLEDLLPSGSFHQAGNPDTLDRILEEIGLTGEEPVLILRANHLVDGASLARLVDAVHDPGVYFMGTGSQNGAYGIYAAPPAQISPILRSLWLNTRPHAAVYDHALRVQGSEGLPHLIGAEKEDERVSEEKLLLALSSQTEVEDGFFARHFDRRISRFVSRRLARTEMTPNQITLMGVAIGLLGAFLLSSAGYWPRLAGALLFLLCVVVDGVDGEVARLRLKESMFGHYLDIVSDNLVHIAVFVGMAYGLYLETDNPLYFHLLWVLLGGFGLCAVVVYFCVLRRTPDELKASPRSVRLLALMTNRDFAYLVAACALLDHLDWFFAATSVGAYLFAAALWTVGFNEKRSKATVPMTTRPFQ